MNPDTGGGGGGCAAAGTAIAYVQSATTASGTAANLTINKPTGTTTDDVMVAQISIEKDGGASITPPSGWAMVTGSTGINTGSNQDLNHFTYYKRAGASEGASYTWTFASAFRNGGISTYRNVNTGCGPADTVGSFEASGASDETPNAPSISTTYNNEHLIWTANNFAEQTLTSAPSGMTIRFSVGEVSMCDKVQATAGASGAQQGSYFPNGSYNTGGMIALID